MGTARHCERYTHTRLMTRFLFHRKKEGKKNLCKMQLRLVYLMIWAQKAMWMCVSSLKTGWIILHRLMRQISMDKSLKFKWKY